MYLLLHACVLHTQPPRFTSILYTATIFRARRPVRGSLCSWLISSRRLSNDKHWFYSLAMLDKAKKAATNRPSQTNHSYHLPPPSLPASSDCICNMAIAEVWIIVSTGIACDVPDTGAPPPCATNTFVPPHTCLSYCGSVEYAIDAGCVPRMPSRRTAE